MKDVQIRQLAFYSGTKSRFAPDISVVIVGDPPLSDFIKKFFIRAALNHSHIGTLYDVGPNFLVMELVEGESSQNISSRRSTTVS